MPRNRRRTPRTVLNSGHGRRSAVADAAGMDISAVGDIPTSDASQHRAVSLDILRGLAILMMVFAGQIPYDKPLPRWLFHAQEPPTYDQNHLIVHVFDPTLPGLTFVDLVFPFFLFALGAAIPLALSKKLDQESPASKVITGSFLRMVQLSWFAVYLGNIRPVNLHAAPSAATWLIALIGYLMMYPMFTRLPETWPTTHRLIVRLGGYIGGLLLLSFLTIIRYYPQHLGFALSRVDVIVVALGDMAFFGTTIWVLTRERTVVRLGFLTILLAVRLGASQPGWLQDVWTFAPKNTGFIFAFDYLKYLFLVIPGTIAGDLVHCWIKEKRSTIDTSAKTRLRSFILLTLALVAGLLVGLDARKLWESALFCLAIVTAANGLLSRPADSVQALSQRLVKWGTYWLVLGILLQPFEGGIKKDPSTLSYYFVTAGLAYYVLAALLIMTVTFRLSERLSILARSGQNPMIAYVSMANLILPLLALTRLLPVLDRLFARPWLGVLLAALETALLAWLVSETSKRKLFWRT